MKRIFILLTMLAVFIGSTAFIYDLRPEQLRALYEKPISEWPKPFIDDGVKWEEFKALPKIDTNTIKTWNTPKAKLGKILFFDPALSNSSQISCSSCHDPQLSWGDGRAVPIGNDHTAGTRNAPSLLNSYARRSFFWDGRASSLEEQAGVPISAHHEMAMNTKKLPAKIRKINGYKELFKDAFGDESITMERISAALADFQRTLVSRRSRFDRFLDGEFKALNDEEIHGMHLFRTKARCMNCHNGQFLTDEDFHNIGLTYYKRKYEDLGRYLVTNNPEDVGKFKTPSLRDVMNTGPWMHNGLFGNITGVINIYNSGMHMIDPKPEQKEKDPLYPQTDKLLQPLKLNQTEIKAIVAFLNAATATQYKMSRPDLPR